MKVKVGWPHTYLQFIRCFTPLLIVVTILTGCGNTKANVGSALGSGMGESQSGTLRTLSDLGLDQNLDLRAGPVDVPLDLRIPSLQVDAPVAGVGVTSDNVMDAPKGSADNPVWQKVFWYRGSGIPGDVSTATMAGHVDDELGRPAAFARLKELRSGDLIIVHDTRSDVDINFQVTKVETYSVQQSAEARILNQIYGDGPVSGKGPQQSSDGLSHLNLITCTGAYVQGSYNQRLVVYATNITKNQQ